MVKATPHGCFSFLITFLVLLGGVPLFSANYYWTGGSGNWTDLTHWATTSGGSTHPSVDPGSTDDVFFDSNSFNGPGQTVMINTAGDCHNMDWTGSTTFYSGSVNGPTFHIQSQFEVFGSLKLKAGMRPVEFNGWAGDLRMSSASMGNTITTEGCKIGVGICASIMSFNSTSGGWTLMDSLVGEVTINFNAGNLNTNNNPVRCGAFEATTTALRTLTFGTSVIKVTGSCGGGAAFLINPTNLTLDATNSTVIFSPLTTGMGDADVGGYASTTPVNLGTIKSYGTNLYVSEYAGPGYTSQSCLAFKDLYSYGNIFVQECIKVGNSIDLASGKMAIFRNNYWFQVSFDFGASGNLVTHGTCGRPNYIIGESGGISLINLIRSSGWGSTNFDYCTISGINLTGGGSAVASNSVDLGGNSAINFVASASRNLFWVANGGSWLDGNHWSLSSGGLPSGCVPTALDNVFFDANSFSAGGQIVSIDSSTAYCHDMSWVGVSNWPTFQTPNNLSSTLQFNIYGSLTFSKNMTVGLYIPVYFNSGTVATITSATQSFNHNVYIEGGGTFNLMDSMRVMGGAPSYWTATGVLYCDNGTFNTNNNVLRIRKFCSTTNNLRTINLGSSKVFVNNQEGFSINTWQIAASSNCNFLGTNSTIYIDDDPSNNANYTDFYGGSCRYHSIYFLNPAISTPSIRDFRADTVKFYCKGDFFSNDTIEGQLYLSGAQSYTFEAGKTILFNTAGGLYANGACLGIVDISSSSPSMQSNFFKASGSIGTAINISLKNMNGSGGATFNAITSTDFGGNSGWTIGPAIPRNLYWIGGTGNWNNNAHWATSSGGSGGNCPPTRIDNVYFDNNSFSASGQIVTLNVSDANCKDMDWSGSVGRSPVFTGSILTNLHIFGSLVWGSTMSLTYLGNVSFEGSGTITTNGIKIVRFAYVDCGTGTYTLQDNFTMQFLSCWTFTPTLNLVSGTLNTNGNAVNLYDLSINSTATSGNFTLNLSSSVVTISDLWNNGTGGSDGNNPNFILNAGTSKIIVGFADMCGWNGTYFCSAGQTYNTVVWANPNATLQLHGSSTYKVLRLAGAAYFMDNYWVPGSGRNTITDSMLFANGKTYTFSAGDTTFFKCNAYIDLVGAPGLIITVQSSSGGSPNYFSKPCGKLCADYIWIKDNHAVGGAYWLAASTAADDKGGNAGWVFHDIVGGAASMTGTSPTCGSAGPATLTFTFTQPSYPKQLIVEKSIGGVVVGYDTINAYASPWIANVSAPVTTTFTLIKSTVIKCSGDISEPVSGSATLLAVYTGQAGLWLGAINTDWYTACNWADGKVPVKSTNVTIPGGITNYPRIYATQSGSYDTAQCNNITIQNGAALMLDATDSQLFLNGNFTNSGSITVVSGAVFDFSAWALAQNNGTITVSGGEMKFSGAYCTGQNNGTITMSSGDIKMDGAYSNFTNNSTMTLTGYDSWGGPTTTFATYNFINPGNISLVGPTINAVNFTNSNAFNQSAGHLRVSGDFTNTGTFSETGGDTYFSGYPSHINGNPTTFYDLYSASFVWPYSVGSGAVMNTDVTITDYLWAYFSNFYINGHTLTLNANYQNYGGDLSGTNTSTLVLGGSGTGPTITFASGAQMVGNLVMNKAYSGGIPGTITLGTPLQVITNATFTNGYLSTSAANHLEFVGSATTTGASDASFVDGPCWKSGVDATTFLFPIGKNLQYHYCGISPTVDGADQFSAEYFGSDPTAFGTTLDPTIDHVSTCDYWDVQRIAGSTNVKVTLSWDNNSAICQGITSPLDVVVAHWYAGGGKWENLNQSGYTGNNTAGSVTASLSSSSYSPFALAKKMASGLPIQLLVFNAKKNDEKVDLSWSTATETNNDFFTVERSADASAFTSINVTKGSGTTTVKHDYGTVDYKPLEGISYYRLKQTDYDGKYTYSQVVPIEFGLAETTNFTVYPNPVNTFSGENATLTLSGLQKESSVLVVLNDVLGKEYYSKVVMTASDGSVNFVIESSTALPSGVYLITASSNNKLFSKKIVVE